MSVVACVGAIAFRSGSLRADRRCGRSRRARCWSTSARRASLALLVGGGFGATGAAMQALFRNPLADPASACRAAPRSARRR